VGCTVLDMGLCGCCGILGEHGVDHVCGGANIFDVDGIEYVSEYEAGYGGDDGAG